MTSCAHPLCELIGGTCSLAAGVSRGCRTGPRAARPIDAEVIDQVRALLAELAPTTPPGAPQRDAATRLARLIRTQARADRNLLVLARDGELDDELAARLDALCRRRPRPS